MIGIILSRVQVTYRYSAFMEECEKLWQAQPCQFCGKSSTAKTDLLPRCSLFWNFKRTIAGHFIPPQIEKETILEANGVVDFSERCYEGHAWCAQSATQRTHFWVFLFLYFHVMAEKENGARTKIVARYAHLAVEEYTLVFQWSGLRDFRALRIISSVFAWSKLASNPTNLT